MIRFACATLLCVLLATTVAAKSDGEARLVVNLLDYIATDYPAVVSGGKVLSESEYKEQLEFARAALEAAKPIPGAAKAGGPVAKIQTLRKLLLAKAEPVQVAKAALAAKREVIALTGMAMAPDSWPVLAKGRATFVKNCVSCHGLTGRGDGPLAADLHPHPTNFMSPKMNGVSPFQAFNTIRSGVPGTLMTAWEDLSDQEVWELAFYLSSLRHEKARKAATGEVPAISLAKLASSSDDELRREMTGSDEDKDKRLAAWRAGDGGSGGGDGGASLANARTLLDESWTKVQAGDYHAAKALSLRSYLEGVEPVEPRLKAASAELVVELEDSMAAVRSGIEAKRPAAELSSRYDAVRQAIDRAATLLSHETMSPWMSFLAAMGVIVREGFEAALIVIALLAVVRASPRSAAVAWIHGGWLAAVGVGVAAWFFSGWLISLSGASRELMEGFVSLSAVVVLLYVGFWLHSRTEISRWKAFIEGQVKEALADKRLFGLAAISFAAVFREAFETVLFLRAVILDAEGAARSSAGAGAAAGMLLVLAASFALVRYSAKLPIRKVFTASSGLMVALAFMIAGKGIHSLQEAGLVTVTSGPARLRLDLIGVYPTAETLLIQLAIPALSAFLWKLGERTAGAPSIAAT